MTFVVRRVLPNEYHKYTSHLLALDADSRHLRFGFNIKDETLLKLCEGFEKNPKQHVLFCIEDYELNFIAIGHVAKGDEMELAFSVLKEYQHKGLGNKLMKRCIQYCRTRKILKGCMVCLAHNKAIKRLCVKNGIHIHTEDGETLGDIELDSPGIDTYFNERLSQNLGAFDYMGKRAKLPWALASKTLDNILK